MKRAALSEEIMSAAKDFHGHLGPFLVLGMRMGVSALRELNLKRGDERLRVVARLSCRPPISCILDGLQLSSGCTLGNARLTVVESDRVSVGFFAQGGGALEIEVRPSLIEELLRGAPEEREGLAYKVAEMPEEELFTIVRLPSEGRAAWAEGAARGASPHSVAGSQ